MSTDLLQKKYSSGYGPWKRMLEKENQQMIQPTQLYLNLEINDVSSSSQCAETAAAHSHHNQEEAKHEGEEVWPSAGNMQ